MRQVRTAEYAGFCFGVKRAVDAVFRLIEEKCDKKIYTIGSLIHNPNVNERLRENGVTVIPEDKVDEALRDAPDRSVFVIRTHGVPHPVKAKLEAFAAAHSGAEVLDMTCPFVAKIYKIMTENTGDDTFTFLFGSATHPEVVGISSYIRGDYRIFSGLSELEQAVSDGGLQNIANKKIISASQTTHNLEDYQKSKNFSKTTIQTDYFLIQYVMLRKRDKRKSMYSPANAMLCSSSGDLRAPTPRSSTTSATEIALRRI
ncbi:MAG: hypothetical protein IJV98_04565 [Clostridia bacterium]|nr:hypothetical protein [Clostridia bacterium]